MSRHLAWRPRKSLRQLGRYSYRNCTRSSSPNEPHLYRTVTIQAAPIISADSTTDSLPQSLSPSSQPPSTTASSFRARETRFETLGATASLLSIHLTPSTPLHTRAGTIVSLAGSPGHATSSLAPLAPFPRLAVGVPAFYRRLVATTPLDVVLAARGTQTAFAVVQLDGRVDWRVVRRDGLVAWTGHELNVRPRLETQYGLTHLGNSTLTGRGLAALAGSGQLFQVHLREGETYLAQPQHVLAHTVGPNHPAPYRLPHAFQITLPSLSPLQTFFTSILPARWINALRDVTKHPFAQYTARTFRALRARLRLALFADRLFIRFTGPSVIILQSRTALLRDVLNASEARQIADAPERVLGAPPMTQNKGEPGASRDPITETIRQDRVEDVIGTASPNASVATEGKAPTMAYARVGPGGQVLFERSGSS